MPSRCVGFRCAVSIAVALVILLLSLYSSRRSRTTPWRREMLQGETFFSDGVYNYELGIHVNGMYIQRNATAPRVDSAIELSRFLKKVRHIGENHGAVAITVANNAYALLLNNWLCNAELRMPAVLDQVIVVLTDQTSFRQINRDWPHVNAALFKSDAAIQYNLDRSAEERYKFLLKRIEILLSALQSRVNVLIFDANSLWLKSPFNFLQSSAYNSSDVIASATSRRNEPVADGMFLLRATSDTLNTWRSLKANLQTRSKKPSVGNFPPSELTYLAELLNKKHNITSTLKVALLPWDRFPDGTWYLKSQRERDHNEAYLVLNNWNVGVKKKIDRVKSLGYWYMQHDGHKATCPYKR